MTDNDQILNSWKEIAQYLGRGVRTAQRWERDMHLPVRRPRGKERSAVMALKSDLDAWVNRCPMANYQGGGAGASAEARHEVHARTATKMQQMSDRLLQLAAKTQAETQRALHLMKRQRAPRGAEATHSAAASRG